MVASSEERCWLICCRSRMSVSDRENEVALSNRPHSWREKRTKGESLVASARPSSIVESSSHLALWSLLDNNPSSRRYAPEILLRARFKTSRSYLRRTSIETAA